MPMRITSALPITVAAVALATRAPAQRPMSDAALKNEIMTADSALFAAFNQRDLAKLKAFFTPDLEFYQDNQGVENYTRTMKDFGAMFGQPSPIHRALVAGSLEVYPIKNYGAIEAGRHQFCHVENGKDDCGTFTFVHIWRKTRKGWKIARVVSYGHSP